MWICFFFLQNYNIDSTFDYAQTYDFRIALLANDCQKCNNAQCIIIIKFIVFILYYVQNQSQIKDNKRYYDVKRRFGPNRQRIISNCQITTTRNGNECVHLFSLFVNSTYLNIYYSYTYNIHTYYNWFWIIR